MPDPAQQPDSLQNAVWWVFFVGIGAAIKWGFDLFLAWRSGEKTEVEMIKTGTDITLALQKVRRDKAEKGKECSAVGNELLAAIKTHKATPTAETAANLASLREKFCLSSWTSTLTAALISLS